MGLRDHGARQGLLGDIGLVAQHASDVCTSETGGICESSMKPHTSTIEEAWKERGRDTESRTQRTQSRVSPAVNFKRGRDNRFPR